MLAVLKFCDWVTLAKKDCVALAPQSECLEDSTSDLHGDIKHEF